MDRLNIGNRNSTPEASSSSSLRPPTSKPNMATAHHARASADMGGQFNGQMNRGVRPASEVYYNQNNQGHSRGGQDDSNDQAAQKWIADIDSYESTLEEMAAATLDQDFKDELSAIEQWFKVLSEAERTAALYALLQQATQVQTRFFIGVLQEMAKKHPVTGVLSPSNFREKDPMTNRLSDAFKGLSVEGSRNSFAGRPPPSPAPAGPKRSSGLDQDQIVAMFPEAAAAIETQKSDFRQRTGTEPKSNRSSAAIGDRSSLAAPSINAPDDSRKSFVQQPPTPWGQRNTDNQTTNARPKSSQGQQPMGQFANPPPSAGPRTGRITGDSNIQSTTLNAPEQNQNQTGLPMMSPLTAGGNWGSMMNTPMVPNFSNQDSANQASMVANATAMKLASLSTIQNRVELDDPRKFRRARSSDGQRNQPTSPGLPGTQFGNNVVMTNDMGQVLSPQQAMALQAQQLAAMNASRQRSRPNSPGMAMASQGLANMNLAGTSTNGFLTAYNGNQAGMLNGGLNAFGNFGANEGYISDGNEVARGRSPRGKRGTSRPPEDPTNVELLKDIPAWLRSLRLHKYTDNLKEMKWQDIVQLDEAGLEKQGVAAQGARRKMLKVFDEVRAAQQQGKI